MRDFDGAVGVFFELGDGSHDALRYGTGDIVFEIGIEEFADVISQNDVAVDIDAFVIHGEESRNEEAIIIDGSREEVDGTFSF